MALGYDGKLYILAFDHRGSFQKKMFGIEGDPTDEQTQTISDAKHLIYEGMVKAVETGGADASTLGVLVDEQFGATIIPQAKEHGLKTAMPVEKSGQDEFDFQYGDDFGAHIAVLRPRLLQGARPLQPGRRPGHEPRASPSGSSASPTGCTSTTASSSSSCSCRPPTSSSSRSAATSDRYDAELRPELMRRAIEESQDFGIEVDIWKIEGVDERSDAEMLARQTRKGAGARASSACCSAAARATRRSTSGCARPRRSRASSASRSAARSGGTR